MTDKKYKTVTVDFETNDTINNPSCPDLIKMKKNPGTGEEKYDGIEFKAKQSGYTFTGISIAFDQGTTENPEWPACVIGSDGNKSTLKQDDTYMDATGSKVDHDYVISYTGKNNFSGSFDPGIENED